MILQKRSCKMIENIDQITCRERHKDKQSLFVMLGNDQKNEQKLLCQKCMETQKGVLNAITFDDAKSRIEKQINRNLSEVTQFINTKLKYIDEFSKSIKKFHQVIEKSIQDIEDRINQWMAHFKQFIDGNCKFSLIQELANLDKKEYQWAQEKYLYSQKQLNIIDLEHSINLKIIVDEIYKQVGNIVNAEGLLNVHIQTPFNIQINQQQKEQKTQNLESSQKIYQKLFNQLVQEIRQNELCYAIGFNKNDSIMAAGYNESIKIWKIQNNQFIDSQIILRGKSEVDIPICIAFSKRINLFVYGSYDHNIGIWNEILSDQWNPSYPKNEKSHSGMVTCIIINKDEDQVISGSQDKSIIIWKINGTSIEFDQQLIKHKSTIFSLSVNQTETEIVSMSKDQSIIIWAKKQKQWEFKQVIQQTGANFGHKIIFMSENVLVLYQNFQRITYIREKVDSHFIQKQQQSLDLNLIAKQDEQFLFPPIYCIDKNIIVQKYDGHVYFIVVNQDFELQHLSKLKINLNNNFYGNMANNGKYLVVWNYGEYMLKIYKLSYL